jgi:EAL domain-containing protein (putative c-di-GMP-specific phosphodiesterase class I)
MARIGELGVEFSLDDFGTGYSSLAQLKRLPVRTLKIDKSFILDIADDRENASIVRSIVALAHSLNLRVVAEGVETPEHVAALARYRCDIVQGLYFGRPLPADELIAWLDGNGACAGALS